MKSFLLLLFTALLTVSSFAQTSNFVPPIRTCNHTDHQHALMQNPAYAQGHHERQIKFNDIDLQVSIEGRAQCANPVTLPMAVHFQNLPAGYNTACLIALAESQIQILNEDYGGYNSDITNWTNGASSNFPGVSNGETCIAFCLATQGHPSGFNLSNGDPAVTFNAFTGDNNPNWSGYINIFVRANTGVLGYSPLGGSGQGDGVVIDANAFGSGAGCGSIAPQSPYNLGRTLTHELGHYLNLNHMWGGGNPSCNADDGVTDTPNSGTQNYGCPSATAATCGSLDMHMNYMDYTNDACMYMFSAGQSTRMENYVAANLQNVANNFVSSCNVVPQAPVASFTTSSSTGCAALSTTFTDNSTESPTSWSWSFPGGSPASSSAQNPPTVTYANPGTYNATLTVSNAQGSNSTTMAITVQDCSNISCNPIDNLNNGTITLIADTDSGQAGGFVAGHNGFGDIAKAEYFTNFGAATQLNGVEYDFGSAAGTGSVEFVIWADNGGEPGAELATQSIPVTTIIADVNANNNTLVDFGGIITIPSSFFAGFKLVYDNTHIVAVNSNTDGETTPTTAYEQWSDNAWYPFYDGTNATWGLQISMAIYPNVCTPAQGQAPVANFSTNILSEGCETAQVQYTDNSTNSPTSWSWSFPGGNPTSSTLQNPTVTYTSAGSYNATLTATNATGSNSTTQTNVVVVAAGLTPTATLNPNSVDLATSGLVTFTDNTAGATSWIWDFGDGSPTAITQNTTHTYTAVGTYTISLTVSDGNCTELVTATVQVVDTTPVGQAPVANFTTNILSEGCETVQIQYTDNSTNSPTSWSWSFPGGSPASSTQQNPTVVYTSAGSYNATLTATNATGNNSTTQNNVAIVSPALNAMASLSTNSVDLMTSGLVTFTDNTVGATSWIWDFGDATGTASTQNTTHTYTAVGTYTISLTVSDGNCSDTFTTTVQVVDTTPTGQAPNASFTSNTLSQACEMMEVQYIDNSTNNPTSWSWTFPGGNPASSTLQNPTVTYNSAGSYNATLTASNAVGNNSTTQNNVVVVSPSLNAMASASSNNVDLMTSGLVTFTDNTIGATSWAWSFGDGGSANTENPTHTYTTVGTYTVTLTVSNGNCTDTFTTTVQVVDTTPTGQAPVAAFSSNTLSQSCEMTQVQYIDNSTNNPTSWSWTFPGGNPASSTQQNPIVVYNGAGSYDATLVATNSIGNNSTTQSNAVVVSAALNAMASASTNTVDLASSGQVMFTDNTAGATSWTWDFGDGSSTNNTQNPTHSYTAVGTYTVTLTVSDGNCTDVFTTTIEVTDTTSVEDIQGLSSMNIYPNPVSGTFFLAFNASEVLELQVEIFDAVGRKVIDAGTINVSGTMTHPINATQLAAGTYFVRITSGTNTATAKVLKF